jgi:hypothetical protein
MANDKQIPKLFDEYRRKIKNTWEEYLLLQFSLSELKKTHKNASIGPHFKRELLLNNEKLEYKDKDIHNFIVNLEVNKLGYKTLIEAVSLTETFLQDLTTLVYEDYPIKVAHNNPDSPASELKLTQLIVTAANKEEMIEALIEEKVRGIFYGKPTDFFVKDKAKIGFGDFFKLNFQKAITEFSEITARRNIFIHSNGKVDSKYLREVDNPQYGKGQKPILDKNYIRHSIIVLRGLSAVSTTLVLQNIYSKNISRMRIKRMTKTLDEYLNTI